MKTLKLNLPQRRLASQLTEHTKTYPTSVLKLHVNICLDILMGISEDPKKISLQDAKLALLSVLQELE